MNLYNEYKNIANKHIPLKSTKGYATFKNVMTNPLGQFGLLMFFLVLIKLLSFAGIVPGSITLSLGFVAIYSIIAIGFCLLLGYSGLASLGTAGFVGLGMYMAYYGIEIWGVTFFPALLIAAIASILLGVIIGFISLRIEGLYLAILTLCLSEVIVNILKAFQDTIGVKPFPGLNIQSNENVVFFVVVALLFVFLVITANLINSPTGRAMLAMKNSTSAAQAFGISLIKYRLFAFTLSTLYAGIGGFLYMTLITRVNASTSGLIMLSFSLNILGAVIVGGAKSLWGTIIGTFFVFGFQDIVLSQIPFFAENSTIMTLFIGILMIVIVMYYPGGFAQIAINLKLWIKKTIFNYRVYLYGVEA